MKKFVIFSALSILIVIAIYFFIVLEKQAQTATVLNKPPIVTSNKTVGTSTTTPLMESSKNYFFPLPDYFSRIKIKKFGQRVLATEKFEVPCGADFSGFHNADDLEVTESELTSNVAVHAVAAGKVLQLGNVSGYGGLLIQSAKLDGKDVTIYYGHVNHLTAKVKVGDSVLAGDPIAFLGKGCSQETSGERKHLHFAISEKPGIDVRGYVPNENILQNWVNPGEWLKGLNASEPT